MSFMIGPTRLAREMGLHSGTGYDLTVDPQASKDEVVSLEPWSMKMPDPLRPVNSFHRTCMLMLRAITEADRPRSLYHPAQPQDLTEGDQLLWIMHANELVWGTILETARVELRLELDHKVTDRDRLYDVIARMVEWDWRQRRVAARPTWLARWYTHPYQLIGNEPAN